MALIEMRIAEDGTTYEYSKVENSIRWLRSFEPKEGYFLAFSGGKDSCVLKALADTRNTSNHIIALSNE